MRFFLGIVALRRKWQYVLKNLLEALLILVTLTIRL
jgi:hypothetical protein